MYFYKAHYHDEALGRFASNDGGMAFPKKTQGMNRMMYVEGNPLRWRNKSGNKISQSWAFAAAAYLFAKDNPSFNNDLQRISFISKAYKKGRSIDRRSRHSFQNWDVSKEIDSLKKVNFSKAFLHVRFFPYYMIGGLYKSSVKHGITWDEKSAQKSAIKGANDTLGIVLVGAGVVFLAPTGGLSAVYIAQGACIIYYTSKDEPMECSQSYALFWR